MDETADTDKQPQNNQENRLRARDPAVRAAPRHRPPTFSAIPAMTVGLLKTKNSRMYPVENI
ncbi:hypothetical protein [Achromobacter sp. 413638]|jgi:hypothetical protein|uniref:hypothetical protein n=1 Tax=Achromobacter sp. 413638 TaxID=3342385 RepID=UPI00370B887D